MLKDDQPSERFFNVAGLTMHAISRVNMEILFTGLGVRHDFIDLRRTKILAGPPILGDAYFPADLLVRNQEMTRLMLVMLCPGIKDVGRFIERQFFVEFQFFLKLFPESLFAGLRERLIALSVFFHPETARNRQPVSARYQLGAEMHHPENKIPFKPLPEIPDTLEIFVRIALMEECFVAGKLAA